MTTAALIKDLANTLERTVAALRQLTQQPQVHIEWVESTPEHLDEVRRQLALLFGQQDSEKADPAPCCCTCGTTNPGGKTFHENYLGQLFCWPCADGDTLCDCHQPPARASQHVQPPTTEERLKLAESALASVANVMTRWSGHGNSDARVIQAEIGAILRRYADQPEAGSLKAEQAPADPDRKCRCNHSAKLHGTNGCRACWDDGLGVLGNHSFVGPADGPSPTH